MTWTVNANLSNALAHDASLKGALTGAKLRIYSAASALLTEHTVGTITGADNSLTVPFGSAVVGEGVTAVDATNATIVSSTDALLLTTDSVGTTGADIPFPDNGHQGWNTDDVVAPGTATIPLTVSVAV